MSSSLPKAEAIYDPQSYFRPAQHILSGIPVSPRPPRPPSARLSPKFREDPTLNSYISIKTPVVYPQLFEDECSSDALFDGFHDQIVELPFDQGIVTDSEPDSSGFEFEHAIESAFSAIFASSFFSDFHISFKNQFFKVHKAFLFGFSNKIDCAIEAEEAELVVSDSLEVSEESFEQWINTFYGRELVINKANTSGMLLLSFDLRFNGLYEKVDQSIKDRSDIIFQHTIPKILKRLKNDNFKDFKLIYKSKTINVHKFLLMALSPVFHTKWYFALTSSSASPYSEDLLCSDYSDKLTVRENSFETFFDSFYQGKLKFNLDTVFDYYHLAVTFRLNELTSSISDFISDSEASPDWVFPSLVDADTALNLDFVDLICEKLNEISDLKLESPLALCVEVCQKLFDNDVDHLWILKTIAHSYSQYATRNDVWTSETLSECLDQISITSLNVESILDVITSLLSNTELFKVMTSFSLKVFTCFEQNSPSDWVSWYIVTVDNSGDVTLMNDFAKIIESVLDPKMTNSLDIKTLKPDFLGAIFNKISQPHLILFFLNVLVETNEKRPLDADFVRPLLDKMKLEHTKSSDVYTILEALFGHFELAAVVHKYVSTTLFKLLLKEKQKLEVNVPSPRSYSSMRR
ncbi:hypothetical protein RCL1_005209 [Eukaryota sp. TZLM3-RCL]